MKSKLRFMLMVMLGIAVVVLLFNIVGVDTFVFIIAKLKVWLVASILIIYTLSWFIRGVRWKTILKQNNVDISLSGCSSLSLFGNFANIIVPAKLGDIVWAYATKKRYGVKYSVVGTSILLDRFLEFLSAILLIIVLVLFIGVENLGKNISLLLVFALVVLVLVYAGYLIFSSEKMMNKLFSRFKKLNKMIASVRGVLKKSIRNKKVFLLALFYSLVWWIVESSTLYMILRFTSGVDVSFFIVMFALLVANITKVFPITPTAIGIYEVVLATVLMGYGVSWNVGFSAALIDHAIKILYVLVSGSFITSSLGIDVFKVRKNEI